MILRRFFIASTALLFLMPATAAHAEEVALTAAEIQDLLTGNTVSGTWNGTPYKSFYGADGVIIYAPRGGAKARGKWRVDNQKNVLESWWQHTGWTAYPVVRTDTGYAWIFASAKHGFQVENGQQIN